MVGVLGHEKHLSLLKTLQSKIFTSVCAFVENIHGCDMWGVDNHETSNLLHFFAMDFSAFCCTSDFAVLTMTLNLMGIVCFCCWNSVSHNIDLWSCWKLYVMKQVIHLSICHTWSFIHVLKWVNKYMSICQPGSWCAGYHYIVDWTLRLKQVVCEYQYVIRVGIIMTWWDCLFKSKMIVRFVSYWLTA